MGKYDYKNICVQIKIREDLTDPRLLDFTKDWKFTEKELDTFLDSIKGTIYNKYSKKIVEFFIKYKDGIILPERYNGYEPVKEIFNKDDISDPIEWLSFPGGGLYLKKKYKYDAEIKNEDFIISCSDGKAIPPEAKLPEYMGVITFWFSKQRKIDMEFLKQLLEDFCTYLNADYGVIFDQETDEVLFDLFGKQ